MKKLMAASMLCSLCSLFALGCDDDETTAPSKTLRFESDDVPVGSVVFLRAASLSHQQLSLQVVGQELNDVYGLAFRLEYSGQVLSFDAMTAGEGWNGQTTLPVAREVSAGLLVGAVTQRGDTPGVAVDDAALAQLELPVSKVAGTEIQFVEGRSAVVTGDGDEVDAVSFTGGRLVLR